MTRATTLSVAIVTTGPTAKKPQYDRRVCDGTHVCQIETEAKHVHPASASPPSSRLAGSAAFADHAKSPVRESELQGFRRLQREKAHQREKEQAGFERASTVAARPLRPDSTIRGLGTASSSSSFYANLEGPTAPPLPTVSASDYYHY